MALRIRSLSPDTYNTLCTYPLYGTCEPGDSPVSPLGQEHTIPSDVESAPHTSEEAVTLTVVS